MQVAIFGRNLKAQDVGYVQNLFDLLHQHGISTCVFTPYLREIEPIIRFKNQVSVFTYHSELTTAAFDFVITLGGDGTILDAVTYVHNSGVPILGINMGRLGYLASIEKHRMHEAIEALQHGRYQLDQRTLLQLESNLPLFGDTCFALNDCTVLKRDTSSMISIKTFINGDFLTTFWADGMIIATPTGSTGYSLSCGGPIIFPDSSSFIITPVAPHNLNIRPIVISDRSVISFHVEGRTENFFCTLDSRFETITAEHRISLRKSDFSVSLVRLNNQGLHQTLREKLAWGIDVRN
jgi:NAD+ kinase